ncbi:hypothetical protein RI367_006192 [Sorochytrium milnesiophthora]
MPVLVLIATLVFSVLVHAEQFPLGLLLPYSWSVTAGVSQTVESVVNLSLIEANAYLATHGSHSLTITRYDVGSLPAKAFQAAITANQSGVVGIVGAFYSSSTIPIALVGNMLHLWQCSGSATSPALSDKAKYPYFFRTAPPDNLQGIAHAQFAHSMKWQLLSILHSNDAYGSGIASAFIVKAATLNIQIASSQIYSPSATAPDAYTLQLASIKSTQSRIIFYFGVSSDFVPILRAAKALEMVGGGWTWVGGDGLTTLVSQFTGGTWLASDHPNTDGVLYLRPYASGSRASDFRAQLAAAYPAQANATAYPYYFFYDCVMAITYGLSKLLQTYTPAQVKSRLYTASLSDFLVPFDGVTGSVHYDPTTLERQGDYAVSNIFNLTQRDVYAISSSTGAVSQLSSPIFNDGTSQIPLVFPQLAPSYPLWGTAAAATMCSIAVLPVVLIALTTLYLYRKRSSLAVKTMSLPFLTMISSGVSLLIMSTLFEIGTPFPWTCTAESWCLLMGLQLVLSAVAAKSYRPSFQIWRIFSSKQHDKASTSITTAKLFILCGFIVSVQALMLLIWTGWSPPVPQYVFTDTSYSYQCESDNSALQYSVVYASAVYNTLLLLLVLYLAYETRTAYSAFRESNLILYCCQNSVLCIVLVSMYSRWVGGGSSSTRYYVQTIATIYGALFVFVFLVGRTALTVSLRSRMDASLSPTKLNNPSVGSFDQDRQVLTGEFPVRITNQLFSKWKVHRVILFGNLGLIPLSSSTGEGVMFSFRSVIFDSQAIGSDGRLQLEFQIQQDAYAIQMPSAAEYMWWKEALSALTVVFGDQNLYRGFSQ